MFCRNAESEGNISASCSKRVEVCLDDVALYNNDPFIDHTHWQSENEKVAKTELLALNAWIPSLLKYPSEVRYVR
jgi:hypothetical protein